MNISRLIISILMVAIGLDFAGSQFSITAQNNTTYHQLVQISRGNTESIAWNAVNDIIAVGGNDGTVWLYTPQLTDIAKIRLKDPTALAVGVAWSPDGGQLAVDTFKHSNTVEIWNIDPAGTAYQLATVIPSQADSPGHAITVAWNPNPPTGVNQLALTNNDSVEIEIWEITRTNSRLLKHWPTTGLLIASVAWSPDGTKIASSQLEDEIHIWDVSSMGLLNTLAPAESSYSTLAWSPDSTQIAGYVDDDILIWNIDDNQPVFRWNAHASYVSDIKWADNGLLASTGHDEITRIWDVSTQVEIASFRNVEYVAAHASWNADGTQIATAEYSAVKVWDIDTKSQLAANFEYALAIWNFSWSSDGSQIATTLWDPIYGNIVQIWDATDGSHIIDLPQVHVNRIVDIAWSPDGTTIATSEADDRIILWDATQWTFIKEIVGYGYGGGLSWSPDNTRLAATTWGNTRVVDVDTGTQIVWFRGSFSNFAWHPDGSGLAVIAVNSQREASINIHDTHTGEIRRTFQTAEVPTAITWSNDGQRLITGSASGVLQIWDANTSALLREINAHPDLDIVYLAYHPDHDIVASFSISNTFPNNEVRVWDVNSGVLRDAIDTNQSQINLIEWSIDGRLAVLGNNGLLKVWGNSQ